MRDGESGAPVAIGVSTGGPPALQTLLAAIPATFPVPIFIVQHMPVMLSGLACEQGFSTLEPLVDQLRHAPYGELHRRVVEALTTNETSFFRDQLPFETLRMLTRTKLGV